VVVFRCTQKLLRRLEHEPARDGEAQRSSARLGDWYANVVVVQRQHLVLGVSGVTLLPVLVPAAPYKTMIARFAEGAGQVLRALKVEETKVLAEERAMHDCVVAPTNDRRVLGSMNDFIRMLDAYLDERSLTEVALRLAEAPCSPIGMKSPHNATLELFATPALRLVRG
jgi:hypothetical protein